MPGRLHVSAISLYFQKKTNKFPLFREEIYLKFTQKEAQFSLLNGFSWIPINVDVPSFQMERKHARLWLAYVSRSLPPTRVQPIRETFGVSTDCLVTKL